MDQSSWFCSQTFNNNRACVEWVIIDFSGIELWNEISVYEIYELPVKKRNSLKLRKLIKLFIWMRPWQEWGNPAKGRNKNVTKVKRQGKHR